MQLKWPKPQPKPKKARKPLERKKRLQHRGQTSHALRSRDIDYMGQVAALRTCVVRELAGKSVGCEGRLEVDHATGRYGEESDRNTIPMCRKHHRERTGIVGGGGYFAGWSLELKRDWVATAIAWTQWAVAREHGCSPEDWEGR